MPKASTPVAECLAEGRKLGDRVAQYVERGARLDGQCGVVDPLARQRRDRPRPDEDAPAEVCDQAELPSRVFLVCPGPRDRLGQAYARGRDVQFSLARLLLGQSDCGDLGIREDDTW